MEASGRAAGEDKLKVRILDKVVFVAGDNFYKLDKVEVLDKNKKRVSDIQELVKLNYTRDRPHTQEK